MRMWLTNNLQHTVHLLCVFLMLLFSRSRMNLQPRLLDSSHHKVHLVAVLVLSVMYLDLPLQMEWPICHGAVLILKHLFVLLN